MQGNNTSLRRILAISAIVVINFNFVLYYYKRNQLETSITTTDDHNFVTNALRQDDATHNDKSVALVTDKNHGYENQVTQNSGYLSQYEYQKLLQKAPQNDKMMQAFLGLVLEKANTSKDGIQAFRQLLSIANTTKVQSRYAAYQMESNNPTQVPPIMQQRKAAAKKQPLPEQDIPGPVVYDVKELRFEPIRIDHGAGLFNMYHAFEPQYYKDMSPTIPHIIHQTWDSYDIPGVFRPWIRSMVDKHPDWQYWFWTPKDVECMLRERYPPQYLTTYQKYRAMIFKSDFLRYFLLYEFGGFYVDLDVEALKPLDFWTYKHQCVMSHENYEHSYLLHNRKVPNVMTTIIGSRPKHPYFKMLQENLAAYQQKFSRDVLKATGPFYLNEIFLKYQRSNLTKQSVENEITVIHPRYWLPKYDYRLTNKLRQVCRTGLARLTDHGKEVCRQLTRRSFANKLASDSYLDHHWTHVNTWKGNKKKENMFNLFSVVPNAIRASDMLNCN